MVRFCFKLARTFFDNSNTLVGKSHFIRPFVVLYDCVGRKEGNPVLHVKRPQKRIPFQWWRNIYDVDNDKV